MSMNRKFKKTSKEKKFEIPKFTRKIVSYWHETLVKSAQIEALADHNNSSWLELPLDFLGQSKLPTEVFSSLLAKAKNDNPQKKVNTLEIVISPVRAKDKERSRRNSFNDFILIPAELTRNGELLPPKNELPWIPREFLEPVNNDRNPTISSIQRVEKFFAKNKAPHFSSFSKYWRFCEELFKYACGETFTSFSIDEHTQLEGLYVRSYETQNASTASLLRILDEVISGKRNPGLLPILCKLNRQKRKLYPQSKYKLFQTATKHLGHFSSEFSLAPSQRTAVHRFLQTPQGEVLSLNGPPGTGKTTVLQSFISSVWVESALNNDKAPPVQLVCGATNQSVLNVINAFEINSNTESLLSQRWIPDVHSYGTFLSSFSKAEESDNYQIELNNGDGFSAALEDREFIEHAEAYFLAYFRKSFTQTHDIRKAINILYSELKKENLILKKSLSSLLSISFMDQILSPFSKLSFEEIQSISSQFAPLDATIRHRLFMLATHYWEGRWIIETKNELNKRRNRNDEKIRFRSLTSDWQRRSMLTPVIVSTISMASRFFALREHREYAPIEVLYFDEAGQISPELGAPISALARKMVVIGDTAQLSPYSNITPHIDEAFLLNKKVIGKEEDFNTIVKKGFSSSSSNLMELAVSSCTHNDGRTIGASLEEHRRSVPEIVSFCNELSYFGRLKPLRPPLKSRILPAFGFYETDGTSNRMGQSRKNKDEANSIAGFLKSIEKELCEHYNGKKIEDIVAILSPFTAQAREIESRLRNSYKDLIIGTVHSLQGAERPVVIFSSVYDQNHKGNFVFDTDPRILNVAVSRAKDSFIVFGRPETFNNESSVRSPSNLLGTYLFSSPDNIIKKREYTDNTVESLNPKARRIATLQEHQKVLATAFGMARKRILIVSPGISIHAIENDKVDSMIRSAVQRKVEVIVFTDSAIDYTNDGTLKEVAGKGRDLLCQAGAKVFVADRVHNKSLAVDSELLVEGSFNWLSAVRTEGSTYQKHEVSTIILGKDAKNLIEDLHAEMFGRASSLY